MDGWDSDDYKEHRERSRSLKISVRKANALIVKDYCKNIDVQVQDISDTHMRLSKEGYSSLDVYPTSMKVSIVGTNKYTKVTLLTCFINNHFK